MKTMKTMKSARELFKFDKKDITHDESKNFRTWVRLDWYKIAHTYTGKLARIYKGPA